MAALNLRSRKVFILLVVFVAVGIYVWTSKIDVKNFAVFTGKNGIMTISANSLPRKEESSLTFSSERGLGPETTVKNDQLRTNTIHEQIDIREDAVHNSHENSDKITDASKVIKTDSLINQLSPKKEGIEETSSHSVLQDTLVKIAMSNTENANDVYDGSSDSELIIKDNQKDVFETLFTNDYLDLGEFPSETSCPFLGLRKPRILDITNKENVSCSPHQANENDCARAAKDYQIHKKPLQCTDELQKEICTIKETWRTSPESELKIQCNISPCKGNPVTATGIHPLEGRVDKEKEEHRFTTSKALENYLAHFVIVNTLRSFSFCFLSCKTSGKKNISQILTFPPILETENSEFLPSEKSESPINLNIVVLDSMSRAHFYRSLPKTVETLRHFVYNESVNATALDFELLQSTAPYTFHNIRAFMSGKSNFNYIEHSNGTYQINTLYQKLKDQGYYTLLQEDSCWFDEWGSLFTNNIFQNKTPSSVDEFELRWNRFQEDTSNYYIDDYGLTHTSCEVFKQYNITNQFNQPRKICYGGKVFSEHFLDYSLSVFQGHIDSGKRQPIFAYTHLNSAHEVTGTRIRQIDDALSGYLYSIAHEEDTMTIVFSDHGPKTTKFSFQTMEGRAEVYDSLLFVIVPQKVANVLGMTRMRAMMTNQRRLITTLDLHHAIMSIGDLGRSTSGSYLQQGIFSEIPANRTCADLTIKPSAVCKCEGWDQRFEDNDPRFTFLAEFALGFLNNNIQENFRKMPDRSGGFGRCQRLVGHSFEKIRRRKVGESYLLTMDLVVLPNNELFEVQITHPVERSFRKRNKFPKITNARRVSIYRRFEKCVDDSVNIEHCVCDSHNYGRKLSSKNHWRWFEIKSGSDVLETVFQANSFGAKSEVKDLHESCLLLVTRKRENLGVAFEIANACDKTRYKVRLTGKGRGKNIVTKKLPISIEVQPRTVHFIMSVHYIKRPFGFYLKTSFVGYPV